MKVVSLCLSALLATSGFVASCTKKPAEEPVSTGEKAGALPDAPATSEAPAAVESEAPPVKDPAKAAKAKAAKKAVKKPAAKAK
jgi:hypothetical protein